MWTKEFSLLFKPATMLGLPPEIYFPGSWQHFWYYLPAGIYSIFSALVGLVFSILGLLSFFYKREPRVLVISSLCMIYSIGIGFFTWQMYSNGWVNGFAGYLWSGFNLLLLIMLIYAFIRSDILDLNEMLLNRHGFFYFFSLVLSILLFVVSLIVAIKMRPDMGFIAFNSYNFIIPLLSCTILFGGAILISGSDPGSKLKVIAGSYLFLNGVYLIIMTARFLLLDPQITRRIEQIGFMFYSYVPILSVHFAATIAGVKLSKKINYLLTFLGVACSFIAVTPFFFQGYYDFLNFRTAAAGPGISLMLFARIIAIFQVIAIYLKNGRNNRFAVKIIFFSLFFSGFLDLLNLIPALGYSIYPPGNLQAIPVVFLTLALIKISPIKGQAAAITARISFLCLIFLPLFFSFYYVSIKETASFVQVINHILLIFCPILISFFTFIFILAGRLAFRIDETSEMLKLEKEKSEHILHSILPESAVSELKAKGSVSPVLFPDATILFADFAGFTAFAESLSPRNLIYELERYFNEFDRIAQKYGLEKLKTMGDSYIAVCGVPHSNEHHASNTVKAAISMREITEMISNENEKKGLQGLKIRIGIHSGPLIAGVIGNYKFTYDIWGDSVNIASRMETSGIPGEINISSRTHMLIQEQFECKYRGKIEAKNKGQMDMYIVLREKPEKSITISKQISNLSVTY